jgi:hypothetical protein
MSFAPTIEAMTLSEIRTEMEALVARRDARGAFHPAEYWRWRDLAQVENSLLGVGSLV